MDTMLNVWTVVENVRVASSAAELAIFTAILYWFFTSSRVADMLEVVGERVGGWCGRDSTGSLRQAIRARRRPQNDVYAKLDAEIMARNASLYKVKETPTVPAPQPITRPPAGLACPRCTPLSRDSWQDPKVAETDAVINILDIGQQNFANGGVVSRYLCDLAQCCQLTPYDYKDIVPDVIKDPHYQRAVEEKTREELNKLESHEKGRGDVAAKEMEVRKRVEARAMKVLLDISSAMSNKVLKLVAWVCHKTIRRVARGGCGTRAASMRRLRAARASGLPLVFVPLHRSHFDYILVTFTLYLMGLRPPLVAAGDNMRIPFFGWFLRGCGAFYIRRRVDGSEYHGDPVYKSALRSYILNSLAEKNNLEFFIEGGRTRTGKPQPPKAGILSVIMEAFLDGTIEDALLVPVTVNYERLVDGNFVREQLGRPKQMETFWSALRGIWRTLNTDHGAIRVDFNQPMSLKELVASFQKYSYLKAPLENSLLPVNNNLHENLDRQILYNQSHSSLYGADVTSEHKVMVEAIGRHLVYEAAQSTALMSTNVLSYVLLTERRGAGLSWRRAAAALRARADALRRDGRDLGYAGSDNDCLTHAVSMLGRGLVRREGTGDTATLRPQLSIAASLELAYYANALVAHYAAPAIIVTALECIICQEESNVDEVRHCELMEHSLQLCSVLSQEFILCAPCQRIEECLTDALNRLTENDVITFVQPNAGIEEQKWSRRFAKTLEGEAEEEVAFDPTKNFKYRINKKPDAIAERRRLLLTVRPLLEAYSTTCRCLADGTQKDIVKTTLDTLTEDFTQNRMTFGEAVSTDAIRNCMRLLKQWGVVDLYTENRERKIKIRQPYDTKQSLDQICSNVYKFNMDTPLLRESK